MASRSALKKSKRIRLTVKKSNGNCREIWLDANNPATAEEKKGYEGGGLGKAAIPYNFNEGGKIN